MWRVLTNQHGEITISFLPVGHTKFFPDARFGMLKRRFQVTEVGCLSDMVKVVEELPTMNCAKLVGDQNGNVKVKTYGWITFFEDHVVKFALTGIKSYSHFGFSFKEPGTVYVLQSCNVSSGERKINLLKDMSWRPSVTDLPDEITPEGLSLTRHWYLHDKTREFVLEELQDLICPLPRKRLPSSNDQ